MPSAGGFAMRGFRWLKRVVQDLALCLLAASLACGQQSSSGDDPENPAGSISAARRLELMTTMQSRYAALRAADPNTAAIRLADYMRSLPEFAGGRLPGRLRLERLRR